MAGRLF